MKMTGVEVPFETLSKIEPNTVLVVISDDQGKVRVVKVDHPSIVTDEAFLKVTANTSDAEQLQGGCWVRTSTGMVWMDPCPY
jgi:hypothetical protein